MSWKVLCFWCLCFIFTSGIFSQTGMLDSTKLDKVGNKKNGFFIEALGSSSVAGVYYERYVNLNKGNGLRYQVRFQAGFSPFTFFRFNFSDGVSIPAGIHFTGGKRFKIGVGMMVLNSFFFEPIEVKDYGYSPVKITDTQYKLFLQPQLLFEYHVNQRFVGKLSFNPTFMPELNAGKPVYTFMPWGGIAFGYKF